MYYDANGNITGREDSDSQTQWDHYAYDALNRLGYYERNINDATTQSQYLEYDANGNRTYKLDDAKDSELYTTALNSNRLTDLDGTAYSYDRNGNIIDDGEYQYSYDARNRLIQVDTSTGVTSYTFNADNQRIKKENGNGTTLYAWDNDRIYGEYAEDGTALQETIYFGSQPIAMLKGSMVHHVFADQIDTPRVVTDRYNTIQWSWDSKPFGEAYPDEDVDKDGTSLTYNLRFPGQYYDAETKSHYNYRRDYNPRTGRYIQSEPIGLDGGLNTFGYVSGNPLIGFDLKGLVE